MSPWNKGKTKSTDPNVKKISDTFLRRKIDNFADWRIRARKNGLIPGGYPSFVRNEKLAFLIGLVLGDGHIHKFPRTERLEIVLGTDKPDLITFAVKIVNGVFEKAPKVYQLKNVKAVKMSLYQKYISERLEVPVGNRGTAKITLPQWVRESEGMLTACLKGLFEAEASLCIHLPTCTYNFAFSNKNAYLLTEVKLALERMGLNPETRSYAIRLRRRDEVKYFARKINFRSYDNYGVV